MTLIFPTRESLAFALRSGRIPTAIANSNCRVLETDGQWHIECGGRITKTMRGELATLGVQINSDPLPVTAKKYDHWLALLPLMKTDLPDPAAEILFVLDSNRNLPSFVNELMRLGHDRIRLSTVGDQVLARVVAPPYYTLLSALEPGSRRQAFVEAAPGVWIEAGFTHPLARPISGNGGMTLIRAPDRWQLIAMPKFRDVYESVAFSAGNAELVDTKLEFAPIRVPLKLVRGSTEPAQFWVLERDAVQTVQRFVEENDSRLVNQLSFAASRNAAGDAMILLRVGSDSVVLQLENAIGYAPALRLANLFVPEQTRLHPPLRRDIAAKLFADDPDRLVWLEQQGKSLVPRSIAESAFRPLADWVEYVVDSEQAGLEMWIASATFDFAPYVVADSSATQPSVPKPSFAKVTESIDLPPPPLTTRDVEPDPVSEPATLDLPTVSSPSQWQVRCDELEKEFLAFEGPLDDPARRDQWIELAKANLALGPERHHEAALGLLNAAWSDDTVLENCPPKLRTEQDTKALLDRTEPTPGELRALAFSFLSSARGNAPDGIDLPALGSYLAEHDHLLPVRAAWLLALQRARLAGGDCLGLARDRDRILRRLLERGLAPELDLPAFLRFAGTRDSVQARIVRSRMAEVHGALKDWTLTSLSQQKQNPTQHDPNVTLAYIDLIFAWGQAGLNEATVSRGLVESARGRLENRQSTDEAALVSTILFDAYKHRIDEVLRGERAAGPLPDELLTRLDAMLAARQGIAGYAIERLRERSLILEPFEKLDAQRAHKASNPMQKALDELTRERRPQVLARRIRELHRDGIVGMPLAEVRILVLQTALQLAPRVGFDFVRELLTLVEPALRAARNIVPTIGEFEAHQGRLFEVGVRLAEFVELPKTIEKLIAALVDLLKSGRAEKRLDLLNRSVLPVIQALRGPGYRELLDRFAARLQSLEFGSIAANDVELLTSRIALAAAWLALDAAARAGPIFDEARLAILAATPATVTPIPFLNLVRAYVAALGFAAPEESIPRILDLFKQMDPALIVNSPTPAKHYSLYHLNLAEEVVRSLAGAESKAGFESRRWLAEDELIVRRRIHRDVANLVT